LLKARKKLIKARKIDLARKNWPRKNPTLFHKIQEILVKTAVLQITPPKRVQGTAQKLYAIKERKNNKNLLRDSSKL
jgi:hypothetical protein